MTNQENRKAFFPFIESADINQHLKQKLQFFLGQCHKQDIPGKNSTQNLQIQPYSPTQRQLQQGDLLSLENPMQSRKLISPMCQCHLISEKDKQIKQLNSKVKQLTHLEECHQLDLNHLLERNDEIENQLVRIQKEKDEILKCNQNLKIELLWMTMNLEEVKGSVQTHCEHSKKGLKEFEFEHTNPQNEALKNLINQNQIRSSQILKNKGHLQKEIQQLLQQNKDLKKRIVNTQEKLERESNEKRDQFQTIQRQVKSLLTKIKQKDNILQTMKTMQINLKEQLKDANISLEIIQNHRNYLIRQVKELKEELEESRNMPHFRSTSTGNIVQQVFTHTTMHEQQFRSQQEQINELRVNNTKILIDLDTISKENAQLRVQNQNTILLEKQVIELKERVNQSQDLIAKHEKTIQSQRHQLTVRERNRSVLENQIFKLKGQVQNDQGLKEKLKIHQITNCNSCAQKDKVKSNIWALEEKVRTQQQENRNLGTQIAQLISQFQIKTRESSKIKEQLVSKDKTITSCLQALQSLKQQAEKPALEGEKFKIVIEGYKTTIIEGEKIQLQLRKQFENMSKKLQEANHQVNEQTRRIEIMEKKNAMLKTQQDKVTEESQIRAQKLQLENRRLSARVEALMVELQKMIQNNSKELLKLSEELETYKFTIQKLKKSQKTLNEKLKQNQTKYNNYSNLQQQLAKSHLIQQTLKNTIESLVNSIKIQQQKKTQRKSAIKQLKTIIKKKETTIAEITNQLELVKASFGDKEEQIHHLTIKFNQLKQIVETKDKQLQKTTRETTVMKQKLNDEYFQDLTNSHK